MFVDTGSNPLRVRPRAEIDESKNFWLTPTFWADGPGLKLKAFSGEIGLRTWPHKNTLKAGEWWTIKGAVINVDRSNTKTDWHDLKFEKVGDDKIVLKCQHSQPGYYAIVGDSNELRAIASRE